MPEDICRIMVFSPCFYSLYLESVIEYCWPPHTFRIRCIEWINEMALPLNTQCILCIFAAIWKFITATKLWATCRFVGMSWSGPKSNSNSNKYGRKCFWTREKLTSYKKCCVHKTGFIVQVADVLSIILFSILFFSLFS